MNFFHWNHFRAVWEQFQGEKFHVPVANSERFLISINQVGHCSRSTGNVCQFCSAVLPICIWIIPEQFQSNSRAVPIFIFPTPFPVINSTILWFHVSARPLHIFTLHCCQFYYCGFVSYRWALSNLPFTAISINSITELIELITLTS